MESRQTGRGRMGGRGAQRRTERGGSRGGGACARSAFLLIENVEFQSGDLGGPSVAARGTYFRYFLPRTNFSSKLC